MRPFLFMGGEKNFIQGEIAVAINKMMFELKEAPNFVEKNLKVLVSGDAIQIDQRNITINMKMILL